MRSSCSLLELAGRASSRVITTALDYQSLSGSTMIAAGHGQRRRLHPFRHFDPEQLGDRVWRMRAG